MVISDWTHKSFTIILDDNELAALCRVAMDNDVTPQAVIRCAIDRVVRGWINRPAGEIDKLVKGEK